MASRVIPPNFESSDLSTFKVLVDGSDIGGTYGVLSLYISKGTNRIPTAQVILSDGDVAEETFAASSGPLFLPGKEVDIKLGYNNTEDTVFKGLIIKHGIKTKPNNNSVLILELRDMAVKMTVGRKNKYFEDVTDSDVIEEILGPYGLETDVESTSVQHPKMVQYFVTDWDFMLSRAEVNGQLVFVSDGKVIIKKPKIEISPVELVYGHNVIEFEAEMDARDQYSASASKSWDFAGQAVLEEEGADPGLDDHGNVSAADLAGVIGLEKLLQQHTGKITDQELKAWADAKLIRSRLAKIKGHAKTRGFKDLLPGDTVEFAGFGDRFNGKAFVSAVMHTFTSETSWYTDISFGLDQEWFYKQFTDIAETPASGLVPPINGLHNGVVTNIHEDPDGEFRVKVRVPVIDPENDGVWARVATLDAGDNRGFFWRPEVEDEVIVGFLNDDPRDPVILGTLHSSAKPSPIEPSEENNEKGIVTRGELKVLFDDDLLSITVETPKGNKIVLSEDEAGILLEDENGNKIQMNADGITIESAADLIMKASGDVTIEGTNLTNTASSQYLAEGSSGAELSSGGQAVIKGAMVAIN